MVARSPIARHTLALLGAALVASAPLGAQSGSETVLGTANIFASGGNGPTAPAGGGAGTAPNLIALLAGMGRTVQFTTVTGTWGCGPASGGPDGFSCAGGVTDINSTGVIAGLQTQSRNMFLVGLFLDAGLPGAAPARLSYSTADLGAASFGAPQLGQVFFIGDGRTGTGSGALQTFAVPDAATRLYLGVADAFGFTGNVGAYDDNTGSVTARYAVSVAVIPEPDTLALAAAGGALLVGWARRRRAA